MIEYIYYIIFFFLILRFTVTLFNFISSPKLGRTFTQHQDKVSILIPVRNESQRIERLIQSIKNQSYKNYEVILLDDSSSDHSFELISDLIKDIDRFKVVCGADLPKGWTGKNFACHQLAKQATGRYLLFLDADTMVTAELVNSIVFRMKVHRLKLLSIFPNQQMISLGEKTVVPLMHYVLLNLWPLRLVYLSKSAAFSAATGQCMVFDAADYHQHQWHEQVKHLVVEDVEIMKLIKYQRKRTESLLANGMLYCHMYESYWDAINGFSKNFFAGFNYSAVSLFSFLLLVIGGPVFVFFTADAQLILFMLTLIFLSRIMTSFSAQQNPVYNLILHPIQMLNMVIISHYTIVRNLTKTNNWKERKV
jgi:glycosyltransferase involved in cell wall biosynthesis